MVMVRKTIEVCDRDAPGREKPYTQERIFALEGRHYLLRLCDAHAEMFDRDLAVWTRLAEEIENPDTNGRVKSEYFNNQRKEEARRITELREAANRKAQIEQAALARRKAIDVETEMQDELEARLSIPGATNWRVTDHARQRMRQREFTITDVLKTATAPQQTYAQPWHGRGEKIYQRGECRIVVDERHNSIITVIDRTTDITNDAEKYGKPRRERAAI
jgi:hypothetical protein